MILTRIAAIAATLIALTVSYAEARPNVITCNQQGCSDNIAAQQNYNDGFKTTKSHRAKAARFTRTNNARIEPVEGVIGGRPAGCPRRYCGCGVSLKVFGKIIPELNLALNWKRKFPRTSPAPGMVAARSGHVFYIVSVIDSSTVVAYDPNSGGGRTRVHERSLRGYTVVNPHGSVAMN